MTKRSTTKVILTPVDHYVGSRLSRRAWQAKIADKETGDTVATCEHSHGHRSIDTACGVAMWRRQPA